MARIQRIRPNSVLPARREALDAAHRRRAATGRRARAAARPRPGGDDGLPASAADPRRDDGQPHLPQGRVAAAGAGRRRGAAVQHPRHVERAGHQRGAVRRRRAASGSTSRPRSSTPSSPSCPTSGWSAGRSAPTWRCMYGCDPAVVGAILLSPPLRFARPRRPGRVGRVRASRWSRSCPSSTTTCGPTRRASGSPSIPQAEVVGVDGASTCGWATPRRCSTRSCAGSPRASRPAADAPGTVRWQAGDVSAYADRTVASFADVALPEQLE